MIIAVMKYYKFGSQINHNQNESPSSFEKEKKHKREENCMIDKNNGNDGEKGGNRDQKMNHHRDYVSSPFVFWS